MLICPATYAQAHYAKHREWRSGRCVGRKHVFCVACCCCCTCLVKFPATRHFCKKLAAFISSMVFYSSRRGMVFAGYATLDVGFATWRLEIALGVEKGALQSGTEILAISWQGAPATSNGWPQWLASHPQWLAIMVGLNGWPQWPHRHWDGPEMSRSACTLHRVVLCVASMNMWSLHRSNG